MKKKKYDVGATFGFAIFNQVEVTGYEEGSVYVPKFESNYVFNESVLLDLLVWWGDAAGGKTSDGMYLFGPTGCGKSAALVNFCALLNIPLYEKTMYDGMELDVLMGRTDILDGDTVFSYGVVPLAMGVAGEPGILVLNEIDRADDAMLTGLYEVLAGRPLVLDANGFDVIEPQPGFAFASTGNTNMAGGTEDYGNARRQDMAFQDRFIKVEVFYPSKQIEEAILAEVVPNMDSSIRSKLVSIANDIRLLHTSGDRIPLTCSTRTLIRWAVNTFKYQCLATQIPSLDLGKSAIAYALDRALLNVADNPTRYSIERVAEFHIGDDFGSSTAPVQGDS